MAVSKEKHEKYLALAHAVQSGVAYEMDLPMRQSATTPKHLRTGVNIAMCEHGGLVALLFKKGIITEEEYYDALIEALEQEIARYEARLSDYYGRPVKLG